MRVIDLSRESWQSLYGVGANYLDGAAAPPEIGGEVAPMTSWLPLGIGVAFGEAFVGNVGSGAVKDFAALGDVVNTAARLQAAATPGTIVIAQRVFDAVRERYPDAAARDLELRGRSASVPLYVVDVGSRSVSAPELVRPVHPRLIRGPYPARMADYVHGYGTREQQRLVEQAEHWRHRLISDGTRLEPGTRLLEVGCGVGAVLAVLGQEFPGARLFGVDLEPRQLDFARVHLRRSGVEATLLEADALALPFADESFDHVWMMWLLEHVADAPAALREARRVLVPGGAITAIEVDYSTCRAEPSTPVLEVLFRAMVLGMATAGWSDAGARLPGWLHEAGFREVEPGERTFWWQDEDLASQAHYASDVIESALDALAQLPSTTEEELRAGLADLRRLPSEPGAGLGWVLHKSTALR